MKTLLAPLAAATCLVFTQTASTAVKGPPNTAGTPGTYFSVDWGTMRQSNIFSTWNGMVFSENRRIPDSEINSLAAAAKAFTDAQAPGRKSFNLNCGMGLEHNVLAANLSNYIWYDKGYAIINDNLTRFINRFKAIGGQVDHTFNDVESGGTVWNLPGGGIPPLDVLKKIEADPRYLTDVRPMLVARGFVFASPVELANIGENSTEPGLKGLHIWNDVAGQRGTDYMNKAIYGPLKAAFPKITHAQYEAKLHNASVPCPDMNGWTYYDFGMKGSFPGTHQAPACYAWLWNGIISQRPPTGLTSYPRTPFNGFRHSVNLLLSAVLAEPGAKARPWITGKHYVGDKWGAERTVDVKDWIYSPAGNTYYYDENILHLGLCNPDGFLSWGLNTAPDYAYLNDLLTELDEVVGYPDRALINTQISSWTKPYVMTGMKAGGRNVWRVTPDVGVVAAKAFKTSDDPITFRAGNHTVIFPADSALLTPSKPRFSCGYWVTSPLETTPVEKWFQE